MTLLAENTIQDSDRPAHDWYRIIASYPPHLVRSLFSRLDVSLSSSILDPFCGAGTTLVEAQKYGYCATGVDAHPLMKFACEAKLYWSIPSSHLLARANELAIKASDLSSLVSAEELDRIWAMAPGKERAICEQPLRQAIALVKSLNLDFCLDRLLALAVINSALEASNLHHCPEITVRRGDPKTEWPVVEEFLKYSARIAADLATLSCTGVAPLIHEADSRQCDFANVGNFTHVITSPPYPMEMSYDRETRLEALLLGVLDQSNLRALKQRFVMSNSKTIYKEGSERHRVQDVRSVQVIASEIEEIRKERGANDGFSKNYGNVVREYFGGMACHLASLFPALAPGAQLAYVVGDQASYYQVHIPVATILAELAEQGGYTVDGIELFRQRRATVTGQQLNENVLILRRL